MLTHRLFGGGSSSPSVSRPSLGSALIAAARALLWSSFRRRSESPLFVQRNKEARKSLLPLRQLQTFSRSPSRLAVVRQPLQAVFTPPAPVLSLRSDRSPSLSSQPRPPRRVSRQASRAAECCSAPSLCAGISPFFPLRPCCCGVRADSCGSRQSLKFF